MRCDFCGQVIEPTFTLYTFHVSKREHASGDDPLLRQPSCDLPLTTLYFNEECVDKVLEFIYRPRN